MFPRLLITLSLLFLGIGLTSGQNCDCNTTFQWLKKTFEENDAGFKYILATKGKNAYDYHNKIIQEKIDAAKTKDECTIIMQEWLRFFRRGHNYISRLDTQTENKNSTPVKPLDTLSIKNQFKNWPRLSIAIPEFEAYLSNKKNHDLEGIWESPPYKIAIKKTGDDYKGVLINDVPPYWEAGQVKLEIVREGGKLKGIGYMRDHSKAESSLLQATGQNYLQVANFWLKRLAPVLPTEQEVKDYLAFQETSGPYMQQLDNNTLYFRIPSFDPSYKKAIDSVLSANDSILSKTPNLIIDIRGNGGGSDFSFSNILPYLKTNRISTVGVDYLSTPLNNQRMLDFINKPEYSAYLTAAQKQWAKRSYDTLQRHLGEFVQLSEPVSEKKQEAEAAKKMHPKQVGIIIDGGVGSTAEQFVLAAKQSKKVKFFGTPTFGSIDISNMYSVKSPCNDYELGYCLSRSRRIPQFIIDDRGLQPDYFISNDVPGFRWRAYVKEVLEQ